MRVETVTKKIRINEISSSHELLFDVAASWLSIGLGVTAIHSYGLRITVLRYELIRFANCRRLREYFIKTIATVVHGSILITRYSRTLAVPRNACEAFGGIIGKLSL